MAKRFLYRWQLLHILAARHDLAIPFTQGEILCKSHILSVKKDDLIHMESSFKFINILNLYNFHPYGT